MTFSCRQCGECCSTMGTVIGIDEAEGPLLFRIRYSTTGESRQVSVDPDKTGLFLSRDTVSRPQLACPFLRKKAPGILICTVHDSRPDICRQYSCYRLLVLDPEGHQIGRVYDKSRYFTTTDERLQRIWREGMAELRIADEAEWEDRVREILARVGYRVL